MKKFIKNCDFISPEITLHFGGETRHSSFFSGLSSIILFILALSLSFFFSLDLLFKRNPTMFSYERTIQDSLSFPLNSSSFFHYLSILEQENYSNIYNKNLFTLMGIQSSTGDINKYINNSDDQFSHWIYEECDEKEYGEENSYIFKGNSNKYKLENYKKSLCISKYYDKDKNKIIKKNDSEFYYPSIRNTENNYESLYMILLRNCVNITNINNNECSPIEKYNEILNYNPLLYLNFFSSEIELNDYKKPIINDIKNITTAFDSQNYIIINNLVFNPITIRTNDGYVLNNNKKLYTTSFDSLSYSYKYISSEIFLKTAFLIFSSTKNKIYERDYKKIQDVAGAVDGFIEILIIVIDFINCFVFHDYQVIHDYADIIHGHVKKYKISQKYNFSRVQTQLFCFEESYRKKKKVKFNTYITKNKPMNFFVKPLNENNYYNNSNLNSNLTLKSNVTFNRLPTTFQKKLSEKYHNFNWFQFLINRFKKNYPYIQYLRTERKRMFSEERIFKNYEELNNLKEYIQKNGNNINNHSNIAISHKNNFLKIDDI